MSSNYLVGEVSMLLIGFKNFLGYPFKHKKQHTSHKSGMCTRCIQMLGAAGIIYGLTVLVDMRVTS